jgi:glycerophosphoryl diester phosphodiesterase
MLILSHRGYHQQHPENTLAAFAAAVAMGVDGIETDLRLSADGQVVLCHDRLAANHRRIGELTRQELSALAGYDVPTAEMALEAFPGVLWNLEIKTPEVVPAALALIETFGPSHQLLVTSFWHNVVFEVAARSEVECGLLVCHRTADAEQGFQPFGLACSDRQTMADNRITSLVWNFEFLDEAAIQQGWQAGFRNYCYGVGTPEEHRRCRELGLDGVITDRPEWMGQE